jgi:hypothetical protein
MIPNNSIVTSTNSINSYNTTWGTVISSEEITAKDILQQELTNLENKIKSIQKKKIEKIKITCLSIIIHYIEDIVKKVEEYTDENDFGEVDDILFYLGEIRLELEKLVSE